MFHRHEPDVLVVGAGPVGLYAANCLVDREIRTEIIDKESRTTSHSYALMLHPESLELLSEIGIDPETVENGLRIDSMAFYDGTSRRAEVRFSDLSTPYPYALVLRQSHLEQLLSGALRRRKSEVQWMSRLSSWSFDETRIRAELEKLDHVTTGYPIAGSECEVVKRHHVEPRFLFGTDGYRSTVRRQLGIEQEQVGEPQLFGVFEFDGHPSMPQNEARVVYDGETINVVWPLPDGRCRWSFQLQDDWEGGGGDLRYKSRLAVQVGEDYFPHLTKDLLQKILERRAPWFTYPDSQIYWSVLARFERRLTPEFGQGRAWLAGDAAHLAGPVGGHSMNVGLREARDLARRVERVQDGESVETALASYTSERTSEWRALLGLDSTVETTDSTDPWVRHHSTSIFACLPASGATLCALGEQMGLDFEGIARSTV